MDRLIEEAIIRGDFNSFQNLIERDETRAWRKSQGTLNTILHLSARHGHLELSMEIVKQFPAMVSVENGKMETPLHGACREGHLEIVKLLLETDPWIAYKVNSRQESVLFAACEKGKIQVVKHLLEVQQLLTLEMDMETTSLHVAAASGYTEIVREILKRRPEYAGKKNSNGCTPLHLACMKGHLDITRVFLKLDPDLCLVQDCEGRNPLHWAVIKGKVSVVDEIIQFSIDQSTEMTTNNGESVLHLGVKNNQFEVIKYLIEKLNMTKLLNMQDCDGNTVLHLATSWKLNSMVIYLLKIGVEANALNRKGYTALDVVEADASNSGALVIVPALQEAGARRCDQLSPSFTDIQQVCKPLTRIGSETIANQSYRSSQHRTNHHKSNSKRRRARQLELQYEGLRNARKTIAIVAVLIATVTFAAGINPPGGFKQDTGIAIRGRDTAFKVFLACDIVALFLSIGVVNILVSIIPFTRKKMMTLLTLTHKIMWVSSLFMIAAYIAGIWTTMPNGKGTRWVSVELIVLGGGSTVAMFLVLGLILARHWHNKYKWRLKHQKKRNDDSPKSSVISHVEEQKTMKSRKDCSSTNSDVDSSDQGYHAY